jgi:hypothetical protein
MASATLTRPRPGHTPVPDPPRERRSPPWERLAFAALCVGAVVAFLVYPTYPNYDSYYSLLWGRELLDGQLPVYETYRAPTPHPLTNVIGAALSLLGHPAERVWILLCVAAFVALAVGVYRLAREAFTPLVGLVASLLLVTRFDFPFYAARGYLDIGYMALVVWAAVFEARAPRRRPTLVFLLLAAAGMLRPEAWVMAGLYWLWVSWRASWGDRMRYAALAAIGPLVWAGTDFLVTGDPTYSLTYTSNFAEELGRTKSGSDLLPAIWTFLVKLDKFPVLVGGIAGMAAAFVLVPRRIGAPFALLAVGIGTFLLVGLGGFSVIDRYLLVASLMVMVFCAVALAGWTMLQPGRLRTAWMVAAAALALYGVVFSATRVNLSRLDSELTFRGAAHEALHDVLRDPAVRRALACGPVTVPSHKLIPDVRWILDREEGQVVARSATPAAELRPDASDTERRAARGLERARSGGVAILVHGRQALFKHALVEETDDTAINLPPPGYRRAAVSSYYSAYVRCR